MAKIQLKPDDIKRERGTRAAKYCYIDSFLFTLLGTLFDRRVWKQFFQQINLKHTKQVNNPNCGMFFRLPVCHFVCLSACL